MKIAATLFLLAIIVLMITLIRIWRKYNNLQENCNHEINRLNRVVRMYKARVEQLKQQLK